MSDETKSCPKCGAEMWDNREGKKNPKAPDFKCKKGPACDGVIWSTRDNEKAAGTADDPACPECSKRMWDNRTTKRNPKAPDFKCRDKSCEGVIWPPKDGESGAKGSGKKTGASKPAASKKEEVKDDWEEFVPPGTDDDEDAPF